MPGKKLDRFLELAKELKKQRKMKVPLIQIIIEALGTIPKEPGKETR